MALAAASATLAGETPYVPASDAAVLEHVPPVDDPAVKAMTALRRRTSAHPEDLSLAVELARAYLDYGRRRGDARYLGYAEAAIDPWMGMEPVPAPAAVVHATLLQSRHQFDAASRELREVIVRDPGDRQAWLTLAATALVQGDFRSARGACAHTLLASDRLVSAGCVASVAIVTGRAEEAYVLLARVLDEAPLDAERRIDDGAGAIRAWALGLMADAAVCRGDDTAAERHFEQALTLAPGDNFLLAGYADFLLDRQRPQAARDLLANDRQSDTSLLRLALAEAALDDPGAARDTQLMAERFAAMDRRGSHLYERERVRFVLHVEHDAAQALELARRNWQVQRAPWDIRVYLAAALAAHRPEAALPALELYRSSGLQDSRIALLAARVAAAVEAPAEPVRARDSF